MCGICGIFTPDNAAGQLEFIQAVRRMTDMMVRRGPDAEGFWSDPDECLQLGFRRLAILDLSAAGNQPMISNDGRSVIVFNGEIYNFQDIRRELGAKGVQFRSRSDTEVLLEALNRWGVDAINRLNGMFAFAWYDRKTRSLLLARDHAGIKPLYYYRHPAGKGLAFASQFNCLLRTPWGEPGTMRQDVLRLYLRLHHIPPPYGLLENTFQLEPGHFLQIDASGEIQDHIWWRLPRNPEPDLSGKRALDALQNAVESAIQRQRIADVPLGVFLSGGIDSPLVTAVARKQTGPDLKAFTIGNPGWEQDESKAASRYGNYLDVDYRVHPVSGEQALNTISAVMAAQYEPFGDYSIIPTLMVSEFARDQVTVALSGDGGDEILFGYERPRSLLRNGSDFRWPWPVRIGLYAAGKFGVGPKRSEVIIARTPGDYYFGVNTRIKDEDLALFAPELAGLPDDFELYRFGEKYRNPRQLANYSRYVEFYGQLQRGLKKVDMASMYHGLEVRVPLLDREVIEVSLRIDPFESLKNGGRKLVLRSLLGRYVPPEMIPQSKRGFAIPLGKWLRGPLRPLVEETLFGSPNNLNGALSQKGLQAYWKQHLAGKKSNKWGIWTILSLLWWEDQLNRVPAN